MASYGIVVRPRVSAQLQDTPPQLQGLVAGIIAFLRVDPRTISVAFPVIAGPKYYTIVFAGGRAFLDYEIFEEHRTVVLVGFVWLDAPG